MKNRTKTLIGAVVLLALAAIPAYACLACVPCGEDGSHVCISAPSSQCFCFRENGNCVAYECTDGDEADACCGPFPGLGHTPPPLPANTSEWRITYNNGFQLNYRKKNPPASFDPLKGVAERFKVEKSGKQLMPITAVKMEHFGS